MTRWILALFVLCALCGTPDESEAAEQENRINQMLSDSLSQQVMIFVKSTSARSKKVMPVLDKLPTYNVLTLDYLADDYDLTLSKLQAMTGQLVPPFVFVAGSHVPFDEFLSMDQQGTLSSFISSKLSAARANEDNEEPLAPSATDL